MTLNSIDVKHLKFKYDDNQDNYTLDDLSFHVKQSEWLSIIGHNGSGKSTTVRLIDGLLAAESGDIFVENELLTEDNVWNIRQKIGMVFQNPDNQFVGATVEDDVAFGLENKGIPLEDMQSRVKEALQLVGMSDFADREPSRLSGGQKQRVAIVRTLCMKPEILLFDEVTAALDPEMVREVLDVILSLAKEGSTMVIVTHEMEFARAIADRIIFLDEGKIIEETDPDTFFTNPKTMRAKQFLNLFKFE